MKKNKYPIAFITILIIMINVLLAARFMLTNDEAYYVAFARNLQLSYVDSPPFVSYLSWFPVHYHYNQALLLRLSVLIIHLISTLIMVRVVNNNLQIHHQTKSPQAIIHTILIAYLCPIFGLYGIFILPDVGLILALSIMIFIADKIYHQKSIDFYKSLLLGLGLGIGLLSKYHIIPLGGGILLGLLIHLWHNNPTKKISRLLCSACVIIVTSLIVSMPMWIWNIKYHFASFKFQLQHGFAKGDWSLTSLLIFVCSSILCITPWFAYLLVKYGLLRKPRLYLVIPYLSLFGILLLSSLRKNVLGHWIAPALWILLPYAVINLQIYGSILAKKAFRYYCAITMIFWIIIALPLALPGGMNNIKIILLKTNHDLSNMVDLLLWNDLRDILNNSSVFHESLHDLHLAKPMYFDAPHFANIQTTSYCKVNQDLIGTTDWMFTAQFEYTNLFDNFKQLQNASYKILNVNIEHANFYLWRDDLTKYASCPILIITYRTLPEYLKDIIEIQQQETIENISQYKNLQLHLIIGKFKDSQSIATRQNAVMVSGHY